MSRKSFAAGSDTTAASEVLASRFAAPQTETHDAPAPAEPARMTTRSWYLPRATADALAAAAERLRHTVPAVSKADALDALLRYALDHETEASQALAEAKRASQTAEEGSP